MSDLSVALNRLAQNLDPLDRGVGWFNGLSVDARRSALRELSTFLLQAHPTAEEIESAVARSDLRRTATPVVLLRRSNLRDSLAKIANLPTPELERSFRLLVLLLGISDGRRKRNTCADGCSHWWHNLR